MRSCKHDIFNQLRRFMKSLTQTNPQEQSASAGSNSRPVLLGPAWMALGIQLLRIQRATRPGFRDPGDLMSTHGHKKSNKAFQSHTNICPAVLQSPTATVRQNGIRLTSQPYLLII